MLCWRTSSAWTLPRPLAAHTCAPARQQPLDGALPGTSMPPATSADTLAASARVLASLTQRCHNRERQMLQSSLCWPTVRLCSQGRHSAVLPVHTEGRPLAGAHVVHVQAVPAQAHHHTVLPLPHTVCQVPAHWTGTWSA